MLKSFSRNIRTRNTRMRSSNSLSFSIYFATALTLLSTFFGNILYFLFFSRICYVVDVMKVALVVSRKEPIY